MVEHRKTQTIALVLASLCLLAGITALPGVSADNLIHDNHGHSWTATTANLIRAFKTITYGTQLWLPAANFSLYQNLTITANNVQIHGQGTNTLLYFHNNTHLITEKYIGSTNWVNYSYGVNQLVLENFRIGGYGNLIVVLGNNTKLNGIRAYNLYGNDTVAAIRFILPLNGTRLHYLHVVNSHTYHTPSHGFMINGLMPNGNITITDVLFDHCSADYAGWPNFNTSSWAVGFDIGEGYNHCKIYEPSTTVRYCTATYCWESGFHIESAVTRTLLLDHCTANYNGQKRNYRPQDPYFASGFIAEDGVTLNYCSASYNTNLGVLYRNNPQIIHLTGSGNTDGLTGTTYGNE